MSTTELTEAVTTFEAAAQRLMTPFFERLEQLPTPPLIYHYTDPAGMRGIMQNGRIWLTDAFALNDPSEISYGVSQAAEAFREMTRTGAGSHRLFAQNFVDFYDSGLRKAAYYNVCSFSTNGDDLGQWRAYASNGRGFALGFENPALENAFAFEGGTRNLDRMTIPVNYSNERLSGMQHALVAVASEYIELPEKLGVGEPERSNYLRSLLTAVTVRAIHISLHFKHSAYLNEQEYRFVALHNGLAQLPNSKTRVRGYQTVAYIEFDWKTAVPGALKEIVIGPSADAGRAQEFVAGCMREFYLGQAVSIKVSKIPYRGSF